MYQTFKNVFLDIEYRFQCLSNPGFQQRMAVMQYAAFLSKRVWIPRWME